ncbi:MAG: cytochrome c3 family protein, partial [Thermoanaerobaculia bacterium]|nr:cytochrome c3 family protein [Thermoanaerobaculia bacterium]
GEPYLRMLPDVHHERGLRCADCHPMTSLHGTGNGARGCIECHPSPSREVPEHAIGEHLDKLACVACHAAWAAQEYGTFLVRPDGPEAEAAFAPLPSWGSWKKSAHLKRQDAPPLGLDGNGNVTPIRPRLLLFATDVSRGWENRLLAAEWRPTSPHTVRRGSVACGGCHGNLRRFLLEPDDERLFPLELDGLALRSYWNAQGQSVAGGAFFPLDRYQAMDMKSPTAVREVLRQWQNFLDHAAPRSAR